MFDYNIHQMLAVLSNAIDELNNVDLDRVDDAALHTAVVELQKQIDRLQAVQAKMLAPWDARQVWSADGSRSAAHRYARETGLAVNDAKHVVHRSKRLQTMPLCMNAYADGKLSSSRVDLLARVNQPSVANYFQRDEQLLLNAASTMTFRDANQVIRYWFECADQDQAEKKHQKGLQSRFARASRGFEGRVNLEALFDPVGGEIYLAELNRLERQLFQEDLQAAGDNADINNLSRTPAQRRSDALVLMAQRSAVAEDKPSNKPLITILVGEKAFAHIVELADGTVLSPNCVVPLLDKADIERIVFDGPDRVMSVSHKRTFTGALRRAIEVRDRHCQAPSQCDVPADLCNVDHKLAWSKRGPTSQENGQLLCVKHNQAKGTGPP